VSSLISPSSPPQAARKALKSALMGKATLAAYRKLGTLVPGICQNLKQKGISRKRHVGGALEDYCYGGNSDELAKASKNIP
jgi:hypothetical protein